MELVSDQARAAKADPDIDAVLAEIEAVDMAVVTHDVAAFDARLGAGLVVHNPMNVVARRAEALGFMQAARIGYDDFRRRIEYAGRCGELVVLMGEESARPRAPAPHAGKLIRRRFTDLWGLEDGKWKLQVRQATIIAIEEAQA